MRAAKLQGFRRVWFTDVTQRRARDRWGERGLLPPGNRRPWSDSRAHTDHHRLRRLANFCLRRCCQWSPSAAFLWRCAIKYRYACGLNVTMCLNFGPGKSRGVVGFRGRGSG